MKKITAPPSGTRDFLPRDLIHRRRAIEILATRFETHGFLPLETPALERINTLNGLYGDEGEKLIFKILRRGIGEKSGQTDLALRYDLTVPAARAVTEHNLATHGFRRYQIGPVWRAERAAKGRFREFWQCDVDLYNVPSPIAEAETIAALSGGLHDLKLTQRIVSINSRELLQKICDFYKIPPQIRKATLIILDKLDKFPLPSVQDALRDLNDPGVQKLADAMHENFSQTLLQIPEIAKSREREDLLAIEESIRAACDKNLKISVNPLLARGLDYYTGFIFEIHAGGETNAIAGGGRYDALMAKLSGVDCPVCGGSLGLERILAELANKDNLPDAEGAATVLHMTLFAPEMLHDTQKLTRELRELGLKVFLNAGGKLGNQLKAAERESHNLCLIYGPDEAKDKTLTLKNLTSGEQETVPLSDLPMLAKRLKTKK
ncbi:MAG: histidine--tRNA ligase [Alphaproteobacteria bacterium]